MSDEDATRIPQQVVRVVPVDFGERHAIRNGHPRDDVARVGHVGEYVTKTLRGNCCRGI